MLFDIILDVVFGAWWIIFAPASWFWPFPANATESTSPRAPFPFRMMHGYFMVICEPKFPSSHSTTEFSLATALFVTRLNTLLDQFWIVVYLTYAFFFAMTSTTAECRDPEE